MAKFKDEAETVSVLGVVALYARLGATSAVVMVASRWDTTAPAANLRMAVLVVGLALSAVGGTAQQTDTSPASAAPEDDGSEATVDVGSPLIPTDSGTGAVTGLGGDLESPSLDVSLERRFNEIKRELLEQREKSIDHWLTVIGLVLTFFAIVVAIAGLWAYRSFRSIEAEAKESADAARAHEEKASGLLREITGHREESERHLGLIRGVTAEGAQDSPAEATRAAEAVRGDPDASPTDKAIGRAVSLQSDGHAAEAINLWRSIWNISEAAQDDALKLRAWFSIAFLLIDADPEEAIIYFGKVLELDPANANAYVNRGVAKGKLGRHGEGIADFDKAIELDPANVKAYVNRGTAHVREGRHLEGIADFDEAIELDPRNVQAYVNRGAANSSSGRHQQARRDFGMAIGLAPTNVDAYMGRAMASKDLRHRGEAFADFDKAIELDPANVKAYVNRGAAKAEEGRHIEGIADFDKAIKLDPANAKAYLNRGTAKTSIGRYSEAVVDLDKAIELDPASANAYGNRGVANGFLGHHEEAIVDLDKAIKLDPTNVNAFVNRGAAKAGLDRNSDAIADFDKAIELDPANAKAFLARAAAKAAVGLDADARSDNEAARRLMD